MIKFFRSLRRKLLESGNLKKYLLYSIGEIILVVVGILIALQINNWNEFRKLRSLEKEYLIDLKKEFLQNKAGVAENIEYHEFLLSNSALILKACQKDTILLNGEPLAVAIEQVGWTYPVGFNTDVWTELNSTGNLRVVSNKSFYKSLTDFYGFVDYFIAEEKECTSFNLGVRRILGDVLNPNLRLDISEKLHPKRYSGSVTNAPDQKSICDKLDQLSGVNGYLVDIIEGRRTTMSMLEYALVKIDDIVMVLDEELNTAQ